MALQTIRSRNLPPLEPSVVTVGIFRGGERFNIIPGEVTLEGTVRTYNEEVRATSGAPHARDPGRDHARGRRLVRDGVPEERAGHGQRPGAHRGRPAPAGARGSAPATSRSSSRAWGARTSPTSPIEVPGFFYRLGVVKPGTASGGLHTPTFRADDSAVPVGIRVMSRLLVDYLASQGTKLFRGDGMDNEGPAVSSFGLDRARDRRRRARCIGTSPRRAWSSWRCSAARRSWRPRVPLVCTTGPHTGRSPNDKFLVKDPAMDGGHLVGRGQPAVRAGEVRRPAGAGPGAPPGQGRLRLRRLRRRRSPLPHQRPGDHRGRLAQPLRPQHVHPRGGPRGPGRVRAELHGAQRRQPPGRPGARRHPQLRRSSSSTWRSGWC